jgi:hypothetical protein
MITKGTGPQGLGSPFRKVGECGGPNKPPCEEELKRMAKKQGFNESYQNSMNVSNVGPMKSRPNGAYYMSPGHVKRAAAAESKKRNKNITSHAGYKAFTSNPNATGVIRHVKSLMKRGDAGDVRGQIPTLKEAASLVNIGLKYANSKDIMKDISSIDKVKAVYHGANLARKYPNIVDFINSRMPKKTK